MGIKELRAVYGDKKRILALNAAIRAEIPGGPELLDLLHKVNYQTKYAKGKEKIVLEDILAELKMIKLTMCRDICNRYKIEENNNEQK